MVDGRVARSRLAMLCNHLYAEVLLIEPSTSFFFVEYKLTGPPGDKLCNVYNFSAMRRELILIQKSMERDTQAFLYRPHHSQSYKSDTSTPRTSLPREGDQTTRSMSQTCSTLPSTTTGSTSVATPRCSQRRRSRSKEIKRFENDFI